MKTLLIVIGAMLFALLAISVWNSALSPDCESLYNEFSSTVDPASRDALFRQGLDNGCFHFE